MILREFIFVILSFREIDVNFRDFFAGAPKMMRYDGLIVPGKPHHVARAARILDKGGSNKLLLGLNRIVR